MRFWHEVRVSLIKLILRSVNYSMDCVNRLSKGEDFNGMLSGI